MTLAFLLTLSLAAPPQAALADDRLLETVRIQVMLDRSGFSPGAIDGRMGPSTRKALEAYQKQTGEEPQPPFEPLTRYRITTADAAGPFVPDIPRDLVEQGKLQHLGYRSIEEAIAERFHTTPALLRQLNAGVSFAEGEELIVPNVEPLAVPTADEAAEFARKLRQAAKAREVPAPTGTAGASDVVVTVSRTASALTVTDAARRVVLYAPVTTGSELDPLPIGEWKVNGITLNPTFNYNPKLFWDADPSHSRAKIPAGPNNPVGLVWIDLSKEHYGIHGAPEPTTIGRAQSHGCVRLTNWDALKLARMVRPGTRVVFTE